MKAYLGIDIGTTAVKAALFDGQGAMLGGGLVPRWRRGNQPRVSRSGQVHAPFAC